ncbi:hypothetical protein [Okeania sp. SIO2B3]|uniref:hypothetical protein n=1 Tax=Okeania sp. SIO2B3 TaxID=2607784 RepID=UPI0013C21AB0|nr:hypothetical protein [Okeania sp. SIO2B3]NET40581.1 hypothetical protein [Okeania sp. SIO2B3]
MGEAPLNIKKWDDKTIPDKLSNIENNIANVGNYLQLIYELLKTPSTQSIGGGDEEVPVPLKVRLEMPTGTNFEFPQNFHNDWSGESWLRDRLDSDLGIDGYKILTFESFDLSISNTEGYTFLVEVDPAFTTIDTTATPHVQVHRLNPIKVAKLGLLMLGGWSDDYLGYFPDNIIGWVKKGGLAIQLSTTPNEMTLNPNLLSWVYFFSVKIETGEWKSAVIDFNPINNKIVILGY